MIKSITAPALLALFLIATSAHADCTGEIKALLAGFKTAGPYHQVTTMTSGATTMSTEGNVILPDQFDITMPKGRMIMTKAGTWMQQGGKWMKMPDAVRKMMASNINQGVAGGIKGISNAKCLGEQAYEGNTYTAFEFDSSSEAMGIKSKSHALMYTTDGKPAVSIIDGEAMGRKSHTVQRVTYDPSIKITAPKVSP